jgi:hypothetical protein
LPPSYSPPTACRHTVSGTISLPSQGCFSPFPHGTGSLSVANEYLALPDGPGRFPRDSSCPAVLRNLSTEPKRCRLQDCHLLWCSVPGASTIHSVCNSAALRPNRPYNPKEQALWFGLFRVRSPLLAESLICFLFLQVLRWFTSLRCLPHPYVFRMGFFGMNRRGFPHSEIPGSKPACGSPGLIAACHVLHRLLAPRHSPYALSSLTKFPLCTLRVCGQRTTDCGVFSCQRISRATYELSILPNLMLRSTFALRATVDTNLRRLANRSSRPRWQRERRLVENTGLEPVTSWLQTRRSPS